MCVKHQKHGNILSKQRLFNKTILCPNLAKMLLKMPFAHEINKTYESFAFVAKDIIIAQLVAFLSILFGGGFASR